MKKLITVFLITFLCYNMACAYNGLKPKGKPVNINPAFIIIPNNPTSAETKSAEELNTYLLRALNKNIPVIKESEYTEGDFISVGNTDLFNKENFDISVLKEEGYALYEKDGNMYIFGGSQRGHLYGVYAFLEEDLGVRWWTVKGEESVPVLKKLSFVPRYFNPPFQVRFPGMTEAFENDMITHPGHKYIWTLRNRISPIGMGFNCQTHIPDEYGGNLVMEDMVHTAWIYVNPALYWESHPEFYREIDGHRDPGQHCYSNPQVQELFADGLIEKFESTGYNCLALSPADGTALCECENCKSFDDAEGTKAATLFKAYNNIIKRVNEVYPNNKILTLAYLDYVKPPKTIKPDKNILIYLCSDDPDWAKPLMTYKEGGDFIDRLKAWNDIGGNTIIWCYPMNYNHFLIPNPNMEVWDLKLREIRDAGAMGVQMQADMWPNAMMDSGYLRAWVWSKQLYNPDLDTKALIKDFVYGYYGNAAPFIYEYELYKLSLWEKTYKIGKTTDKDGNPIVDGCRWSPYSHIYPKDFQEKSLKIMDKAVKACGNDSKLKEKVDIYRAQVLYYILAHDLGYFNGGKFIINKLSEKEYNPNKIKSKEYYYGIMDELRNILDKEKVGLISEQYPTVDFRDRFFDAWKRTLESPDLSSLKWVDINHDWYIIKDEENKGEELGYYKRDFDFSSWTPISVQTNWETEIGIYDGYCWYKTKKNLEKSKHVYLYFGAVDEDAWVYVNGKLILEHTCEKIGINQYQIWTKNFTVDIAPYLDDEECDISVKVLDRLNAGGIYKGVKVGYTDSDDLTVEDIEFFN